jgi:hypothetical protein
MLNIILLIIGAIITVVGAYSIIGIGIHIANRHLFRSKTMRDVVLPGLILLFTLFDVFLWFIIYHICHMFGG